MQTELVVRLCPPSLTDAQQRLGHAGNGVTVLAPRQHAVRAEHGLKLVEDGSAPRGAPTVVHISSAHELSCPGASHGDAQAAF